jgi:hypothetical protein
VYFFDAPVKRLGYTSAPQERSHSRKTLCIDVGRKESSGQGKQLRGI